MTLAAIFKALVMILKLVGAGTDWLRQQQAMGDAEDAVLSKMLGAQLEAVERAKTARLNARSWAQSHPGELPNQTDDPNRRD